MRPEQRPWAVEFCRDARGESPIEAWVDALHDPRGTIRARIDATLIRLREAGGRLPEPCVKHLRDKLWELRWHVRGEYLRVIFATVRGRIILLLCGFTKKSVPLPEPTLADNLSKSR